jgi:hypothetical protein
MDSTLMEWGPAHLRDEATPHEIELTDRPDDN